MEEATSTRDYTGVTTKQIVVEMLKENTGTHFLDSGGAYGRNWQRNQLTDFDQQPACWYEWSTWRNVEKGEHYGKASLCATISLYHWMVECLKFEPELQERLDRFVAEEANDNWSWLHIQEEFADLLHELGESQRKPEVVNTYNNPDTCDLSQTLQYVELYLDDDYEPSHLIVSVHGGCDVRGGYGAPKVFSLRCEYYEALDRMQVRDLGLLEHSAYWTGDGGYLSSTQETGNNYEVSEDLVCDILQLPCWDIAWDDEDLDVADIRTLISKADQAIKDVSETSLDEARVRAAQEEIRRQQAKLRLQLREAVGEWLYVNGEGPVLLVDDRRRYVVFSFDGEITLDEVQCYPGF